MSAESIRAIQTIKAAVLAIEDPRMGFVALTVCLSVSAQTLGLDIEAVAKELERVWRDIEAAQHRAEGGR